MSIFLYILVNYLFIEFNKLKKNVFGKEACVAENIIEISLSLVCIQAFI